MRVGVAIAAAAKWDSDVLRKFVGSWRVTSLAWNLDVQTGQGITRERVVELPNVDLAPLVEVVTLQAVGPEAPPMLVVMAIAAGGGNTQKCFAEILDFDGQAFSFGHALWGVAAVTAQSRMLTFEFVAGLLMIEGWNVPFCQDEIFAIVFGMAVGAFRT